MDKKIKHSDYYYTQQKRKEIIITLSINLIVSIISILIILLLQKGTGLKAWVNAFALASAISFTGGWFMYIYNERLFSAVRYGFGSFFKKIMGRETESYFDYIEERDNVSSHIIKSSFYYSLVMIIITVVIFTLYK